MPADDPAVLALAITALDAHLARAHHRDEPGRPHHPRRQRPAAGRDGRLRLAHPLGHQHLVRPAVPDLRLRAGLVPPVVREVPVVDPPRRPGPDHRGAPERLRHRRALPDDRADRASRRRGPLPLLQRSGDHGQRGVPRSACAAPASTSPNGCWPTGSGSGSRHGPGGDPSPDAILVLGDDLRVLEANQGRPPAAGRRAPGPSHPRDPAGLAGGTAPPRSAPRGSAGTTSRWT